MTDEQHLAWIFSMVFVFLHHKVRSSSSGHDKMDLFEFDTLDEFCSSGSTVNAGTTNDLDFATTPESQESFTSGSYSHSLKNFSFEHSSSNLYFFTVIYVNIDGFVFRLVTSRSGICWTVWAWFIIVIVAERSREDEIADGRLVVLLVSLWRIRGKNRRQADAVDWWRTVKLECKQFLRLATGEWKMN